MKKSTAKMVFAGSVGGGMGLIGGTVLADLYQAVLAPALKTSTASSPGITQMGTYWHAYITGHGYLPWHALPLLAAHPDTLLVPAALALVFGGVLLWKAHGPDYDTWGGPPTAGKGQHGTAHWRPIDDLADGLYAWQPADKKGVQPAAQAKYDGSTWPRSGIITGQAGPTSAYVANREDHVLLIGTTGAGKSRRVFLPTIGILGYQGESSFVLSDPKGELYEYSAGWLRTQGYDVVRFDLRDPRKGGQNARWNPILPIAEALARGDVGFASRTAWQVAHGIGAKSTKVADEYWSSTAESAMAALILGVAAGNPFSNEAEAQQAEAKWQAAAMKLWAQLPEEARPGPDAKDRQHVQPWQWPAAQQANLISVYRSLVYGGQGGSFLDAWINLLPSGHPARDAWATVAASGGSEKTRAGILSSALADLRLLSEPDLQWLLSDQGMSLDQPGRRKTAVFLIVPDDDSTRYPLATLYLSQMIAALTRLADSQPNGRLKVPVMFLLDEFGNFPPMPNLSQFVTAARSRGMRLLMGLQSFSQLEHAYGREVAATVRENLGTWIYLLTSSPGMAEEISKRLGTYTTHTESSNFPKVSLFSLSSSPNIGSTSEGKSLTSRPLLTPDEVMRWPLNQALILQQRKAPSKLPLPDLSAWQAAGLFTELKRGEAEPVPAGGPEANIWWPLQPCAWEKKEAKENKEPQPQRKEVTPPVPTNDYELADTAEPADDEVTLDTVTTTLFNENQDQNIFQ